MTLSQKHEMVYKHIAHYRYIVRHWTGRRTSPSGRPLARFIPAKFCPALGVNAPRVTCGAGQKLVHALKVMAGIDDEIETALASQQMWDANADWPSAAKFADRIFPGTYGWVWSCSGSEGGHGIWVWNGGAPYNSPSHGSGAGGWMQFLDSTFWNNVDAAFTAARERGFNLPASTKSYTSALGQAVTAAYMDMRGWSGQWYGAGC